MREKCLSPLDIHFIRVPDVEAMVTASSGVFDPEDQTIRLEDVKIIFTIPATERTVRIGNA